MRWYALNGILAIGLLACGGERRAAAPESQPGQPGAATPAATAPTGPVVEVEMTGNGTTKAAFEPNVLSIKTATTVRFINVSGGPHNITFYPDSIPTGAAAALKAGMPNPMGDLSGPFLTQPNQTYDVSFVGAPKGIYKGYCIPHVALGMKITIRVE
jgi:plastocyanin